MTVFVILMLIGIASWILYDQLLSSLIEEPQPLISSRLNRRDEIVEIELYNLKAEEYRVEVQSKAGEWHVIGNCSEDEEMNCCTLESVSLDGQAQC